MGIIWGFISALCFGSADFVARDVSIQLTPFHALFYIHLVSGVLLAIVLVVSGIPASATASAVGLAALLGAANTAGTLLLYRALSVGKISVTSPITSTFGGVALLLSLVTGDVIPSDGVLSLVLMLVGIVIVTSGQHDGHPDAERDPLRGVPEAVIASLAFGLNFWGLQFVVTPLGLYIPTLIGRIMTVLLLPLFARPLHQSITVPPRNFWLKIGLVCLITTLGEVAYNTGVQGTTPGIVAVLSSLFSPVTLLLALIFLRERLARRQWVGVGVIFISTLLVGIFQNFSP